MAKPKRSLRTLSPMVPISPIINYILSAKGKQFGSNLEQSLRDRMFKAVPPVGYYPDRIGKFIRGEDKRLIEDLNTEAIYGKYLNQDSIIGTVGKFPRSMLNEIPGRYLTDEELDSLGESDFNRWYYRKAAVDDYIIPSKYSAGAYEFKYPAASDIPNETDKKKFHHGHALATYTIEPGRDKKGSYVQYTDSYDINPLRGVHAKDFDRFGIGKLLGLDKYENLVPFGVPVKIVGRHYKD